MTSAGHLLMRCELRHPHVERADHADGREDRNTQEERHDGALPPHPEPRERVRGRASPERA